MPQPFVVLQSFRTPRPTTNPYVIQLADRLRAIPDVTVLNWTWRGALLNRFDVFHVHWPESLFSTPSAVKRFARHLLYAAFLLRLRVTRTPLVRTVHNLDLPQGVSRLELFLLRLTERWTTVRIAINATTPMPPDQAWAVIPHGHYRDWFAGVERPEQIPGRIAYVGLIRRYKGVDRLVRAFVEEREGLADCSLRIAGKPSTDELAEQLRDLAGDDQRVSFQFGFLDDEELVRTVAEAELVVLPYLAMHNSGATLTTLSLDRPALVPDNETNEALAEEVGPGWVHRFHGELDSAALVSAVREVRSVTGRVAPDLSRRNWDVAGTEHLAAYRRAVDLVRRRPWRRLFGRG